RLLPGGIALVPADDVVAQGFRPAADLREPGDLEGHVMDPGAVSGQEAMEETIRTAGVEYLETAAAPESPARPAEDPGGLAPIRDPSQRTHHDLESGADTRWRDGDMVERGGGSGPFPC